MHKRRLKLNDSKIEMMIVRGTNQFVGTDDFGSSVMNGVNSVPMDSVRNLGVIFGESFEFFETLNILSEIVIIAKKCWCFEKVPG